MNTLQANLVNAFKKEIYPVTIEFDKRVMKIEKIADSPDPALPFLMPGFVDAHVHIESSMLIPSEFARIAVTHGTVATVSDPHEIANVCGVQGVHYMIDNGKRVPFKFNFGAPSCVPATAFETAGAVIDAEAIKELLILDDIKYLAEMMNFPGVLNKDPEVLKKIKYAKDLHKPVDGHAPGLRGEQAAAYIQAGISTDHECFTRQEALDKLQHNMKILIREGSAAKNFEALIDLLNDHEDEMMFCSDDKHPDSLVEGHIDRLCARAVQKGVDIFKVVKAACINPVFHYKLEVGLLRVNEPADFILVNNLKDFKVLKTFIDGQLVAENGQTNIAGVSEKALNNFAVKEIKLKDLRLEKDTHLLDDEGQLPVIEAYDGQLITGKVLWAPKEDPKDPDAWVSDPQSDILKIVVVNRYHEAKPAMAFIKGFGIKKGAIASTVAHDSHNIVAVGVHDQDIMEAINVLVKEKGGISISEQGKTQVLPLPVAGLMSNQDGFEVAKNYGALDNMAKKLQSSLSAPYMTLSFMALLVIPALKLSDKGLFDGERFEFVNQ
ncbi:Adenine deaminase [Arachidicoccus rhizosphaerae]|uniref:Adenine deaminase n=1 Tax=Arachidicoccus rhizosphaerae TaxID=551991 RepID=A0A1H3ZIF6_9BACT|nr:adenine deaminase [Arachidicoccus rhizosphaerae]SEA23546.1 Adenine deaminase [Arachidicoccus rhizosphaerae]